MDIEKSRVVEALRARGDNATADQAEMSLPSRMDSERDRELLARFGVQVHDLTSRSSDLSRHGD